MERRFTGRPLPRFCCKRGISIVFFCTPLGVFTCTPLDVIGETQPFKASGQGLAVSIREAFLLGRPLGHFPDACELTDDLEKGFGIVFTCTPLDVFTCTPLDVIGETQPFKASRVDLSFSTGEAFLHGRPLGHFPDACELTDDLGKGFGIVFTCTPLDIFTCTLLNIIGETQPFKESGVGPSFSTGEAFLGGRPRGRFPGACERIDTLGKGFEN